MQYEFSESRCGQRCSPHPCIIHFQIYSHLHLGLPISFHLSHHGFVSFHKASFLIVKVFFIISLLLDNYLQCIYLFHKILLHCHVVQIMHLHLLINICKLPSCRLDKRVQDKTFHITNKVSTKCLHIA